MKKNFVYIIFREALRPLNRFWQRVVSWRAKARLPKGAVCQFDVKRVAFFCGCHDNRSERYRIDNIIEALKKYNIIADKYYDFSLKELLKNQNYDILVIFRGSYEIRHLEPVVKMFKEKNIPIVFDTDDLIFDERVMDWFDRIKHETQEKQERFKNSLKAYKKTLLDCDYATVSTSCIQSFFNAVGFDSKNSFVFKLGINEKQFKLAQKLNKVKKFDNEVIKISYLSGTATHNKDFEQAENAILKLLEEFPNLELHIVGPLVLNEKFDAYKKQIKRKKYMGYLSLLKYSAKMDINIAPLELNNPYNDCKAETKIFEAALVKVPCVVSPIDSYQKCIENEVTGYLASNDDEWYKYLKILVTDKNKRKEVAEASYEKIAIPFCVDNQISGLIDFYNKIVKKENL